VTDKNDGKRGFRTDSKDLAILRIPNKMPCMPKQPKPNIESGETAVTREEFERRMTAIEKKLAEQKE